MSFPTVPLPGRPGWTLRAWRQGDAPALSLAAGDPQVWRWMSDHFPHPYTLAHALHWVDRGHIDFGGSNGAIAYDDFVVGGAGFSQLAGPERCNVEVGYFLVPAVWRQGIGTAVVAELVRLAWALPEVTRVYAPIHAGNQASAGVLQKNGFVREGLQRLSAFKAGRVIDIETWALYRDPIGSVASAR